ncbi:MAG: threonine synthase [Peptoniphilus sp.]|nr:threonine synthase [Peptoniphilus sp.]MDD7362766.1 threonine synthase [Bacillota bacterium]MDY6044540.1 threonine synthase [Peptoniphilus sp.]
MKYYSTRDRRKAIPAKEAIFRGPADDGGLYVPEYIPSFSFEDYLHASYSELACAVLETFFEDFDASYLKESAQAAYKEFDRDNAVGYTELGDVTVAELFHGPTAAFKDFALQMLPYLMKESAAGRKVRILTATSGDTGKAALAGFKDVENTDIFVFYPANGVSTMQKRQMTTQEGENVHVYGIDGNFDDAQRTVKEMFQDDALREEGRASGIEFSSANSINIGRLVPQIVYYIYSYLELVRRGTIEMGETVDICVPTGNFGNILASMYAKRMGLPFGQFICASNKNHVLTDFINTGVYDTHRDFYKTTSPSMDILVASNIERYLQLILKRDEKVKEKMDELKERGRFDIPVDLIRRSKLVGYWTTDAEGEARIKDVFERYGYLMDPHTAVAYDGVKKHASPRHVLLMATASPYKFPETVADALNLPKEEDTEALLREIEKVSSEPIPKALEEVFRKPERFKESIKIDEMPLVVKEGFDD